MANLGATYDASQGESMEDRSILPAGEYPAALAKSEIRESKANPQNRYIWCEFEVIDGERKGARFWTNINLWNSNHEAVQIAQREFNSLCRACGKLQVQDTDELLGLPFLAKLGIKKGDGQYDDQNSVKAYKPFNGAGQATPPNTPQSGGPGAAGGAPWGNRAA